MADQGVCGTCGYNLPYHEFRCPERGLSEQELKVEYLNMSDCGSNDRCERCGGRFGGAGAKLADGKVVHKNEVVCTEKERLS